MLAWLYGWMHRFDAAVRTDSYPKYALFKSALSGALFAYNRADIELLVKSERAASLNKYRELQDDEVLRHYISKSILKHHVQRVTLGAQETFRVVDNAIQQLKGPDGLDDNGDHIAAKPFQIYLLSGLARWNADRHAAAVFGCKGRKNRIYSSSLIHHLNKRCRALFGEEEVEETNSVHQFHLAMN
ncbi:hypothetical protein LSH36_242g00013 [Paralvinella palmiformis]|uniref:Uncharacterized protein n=1 Tax=Paralvinella palmiformis TaxID=53620 RepID=A0AAD9JLC2_9ANNE|nr:hypothetical protein LSH36_242g00013 [Paralvinella palmiformis]